MSIIEKQVQLGRDLFEINAGVARRLFELQSEGVRQYFETSQEYAQRLPEVKDVQSFFDLQREYGETVWNKAQEDMEAGREVVREATESATEKVREAWTNEADVEEAKAA